MTGSNDMRRPWPARALTALGALMAAVSIALAAYAAHGLEPQSASRLQLAAVFAFGHGVALAALARTATRRLTLLALLGIAVGACLFAGSLLAAHFFDAPTRLAPFGGSLMILAWLAYAVDAMRR